MLRCGKKTHRALAPLETVKSESRSSLRSHSFRLFSNTACWLRGGRQLTGKQRCAHFAVAQKSSFTHQKAPDFNPLNFHTVPQRCINVKRKSLFSPWLCPLLWLDVQETAPEKTRWKMQYRPKVKLSGGAKAAATSQSHRLHVLFTKLPRLITHRVEFES